MWTICDNCDGNGTTYQKCETCDGSGDLLQKEKSNYRRCDVCHGVGKKSVACEICNGEGKIMHKKSASVGVDRNITKNKLYCIQEIADLLVYSRSQLTVQYDKITVYLSFSSRRGANRHVKITVINYCNALGKYTRKNEKIPIECFKDCEYEYFIKTVEKLIEKEV